MIDIVDLESGALLVRHIVPGYGQLLNDGTPAMMKVSDDGIYQIDLFELDIVGL